MKTPATDYLKLAMHPALGALAGGLGGAALGSLAGGVGGAWYGMDQDPTQQDIEHIRTLHGSDSPANLENAARVRSGTMMGAAGGLGGAGLGLLTGSAVGAGLSSGHARHPSLQ